MGLLYSYFESKEELLREIFNRGNRDIEASLSVPWHDTAETTNHGTLEQHIL
ncbi:hypothetical protein GCM10023188_10950 [Pontibacter saemangeumensis]|uniref:Transcriptional regulator, TetR family n=1 Tax=Pontibacter saemangeumensis TaxID=1084525 RepID=A0ABP8LFX2_9BACT